MDENNNIIYYINNNVYNDSKIPLIKYLKTIEKYGTEAGDLEISSASKNYDIDICIYTKAYNNITKEFIYNKLNIFGRGDPITLNNINNTLFIEYSNNNHYDVLLYKKRNIQYSQ